MARSLVIYVGAGIVVWCQVAKLVATLQAIQWLLRHGRAFARLLAEHKENLTEETYWTLLDKSKAKYVGVAGILEYRLYRLAARVRPLLGRVILLVRWIFFDFTSLGLLSMVLMFAASAPPLSRLAGPELTYLAAASGVLAVAQLLAIYAEACISYAALGSYGRGFHGGRKYSSTSPMPYVREVSVLAGAVLYSLLSGTFLLYFVARHGGSFSSLSAEGTTLGESLADLLDCAYYSLMTFFTADSAGPISAGAKAVAAALVAQAVCALILALTTFTMYTSPRRE